MNNYIKILRQFIFLIIGVFFFFGCNNDTKKVNLESQNESHQFFYPPIYPWHIVDIWWNFNEETNNFANLSIDFEIIGKIDDRKVDLYIAPMGLGKINNISFYGGIQTNSGGWKSKNSRKIIKIGRGGIFSRWSKNDKPISLDYADGDNNTYYESAGYEGQFVSVRSSIKWKEGKYKYIVRKLTTTPEYAWFGAFIYDYSENKEFYIGSLKFEGSTFKYSSNHASFLEVYGNKSYIPEVSVIYYPPIINSITKSSKKVTINFPKNNSKLESVPRFAEIEPVNTAIMVTTIPEGINDNLRNRIIEY